MTSIGFIGFGRMGKNMVLHLFENGISVVGYNRTVQVTHDFAEEVKNTFFSQNDSTVTFTPAETPADFLRKLPSPRVIFLMVKAGQAVDQVLTDLLHAGLAKGDIVIDGGNSFYKDTVRRHDELVKQGIHYIDCGVSGGLEGGRYGACLMLGGTKASVDALKLLWNALARKSHIAPGSVSAGRWDYMGESGAGHFVKMVHNGIEYGIDEALGEGFALLNKSPYPLSLPTIAKNWSQGSVIRGWLVELIARALTRDQQLSSYVGQVGGGETGQWAIDTAHELGVEVPAIEEALVARHDSQKQPTFAGKIISALRFEYGGHSEVAIEGGKE